MNDSTYPQGEATSSPPASDEATDNAPPVRAPLHALLLTILRALFSIGLVAWLYFALDASRHSTNGAIALIVGLCFFIAYTAWQGRRIAKAKYPQLRAIETLASVIPLFLFVFATVYLRMSQADASAFSEPLDKGTALYFTIVVFSTTGFGDIVPRLGWARAAVNLQMLIDLFVVGTVLRFLFKAVSIGRARRADAQSTSPITSTPAAEPR
ncbi:MAG: potassium channel family protein [Acidimicrobiia bacterium]